MWSIRRVLFHQLARSSIGGPRTSSATTTNASEEAVSPDGLRDYVKNNIVMELSADSRLRLFAVVYLNQKQFKMSQDDIIHLERNVPLDVGDRIKLEKILMVGAENFTLIGRPLLDPRLVNVHATVIEKSTTSPEVIYNPKIQKPDSVRWISRELTVLRINGITLDKDILTAERYEHKTVV